MSKICTKDDKPGGANTICCIRYKMNQRVVTIVALIVCKGLSKTFWFRVCTFVQLPSGAWWQQLLTSLVQSNKHKRLLQKVTETLTWVYMYWKKKNWQVYQKYQSTSLSLCNFVRQRNYFQLTMKTVKYSYSWDYTENTENRYMWSRQWCWGKWKQGDFLQTWETAMHFGISVKYSHTKWIFTNWRSPFIFTHLHTMNQTFKETWFHHGLRLI